MAKILTSFSVDWKQLKLVEDDYVDNFSLWLVKGGKARTGYCKLCLRTIDVSAMGSSAMYSHVKCGKHRKNVLRCKKSVLINFFCQSSSTEKEDTTHFKIP